MTDLVTTKKLDGLQSAAAKFLTYALWAHLPLFFLFGFLIEQEGMAITLIVSAVIIAVPTAVLKLVGPGELHRYLTSASVAMMPALLVIIFRGHPWQIDAHMYFFAALAVLAALSDAKSIIVATIVIAVHHLLFNLVVPAWVFPEGGDLLRVMFHAVVVVLEAAVLYWAAGKLAVTLNEADAAEAEANKLAETAKAEAASAAASKEEAEAALAGVQEANAEKARSEAEAEEQMEAERERQKQARIDLAEEFEQSLGVSANELAEVSNSLSQEAQSLRSIATESTNAMSVASNATDNVSQNVNSVASSAEEMSASVSEIARQVSKSTQVVEQARGHAGTSETKIKELADRADKINDVLTMIGEIAEQTNLLALNATIEAARAGDAGKGFAVVASEVKSLANQSAGATEEIGKLLTGIREATGEAVDVNKTIVDVINEIGENSNSIAAAVEEQSAATEEIARAAQTAAGETVEASQAVNNLVAMTDKVDEVSSMTANAVSALSEQTKMLSSKSDEFVVRIRA